MKIRRGTGVKYFHWLEQELDHTMVAVITIP